MTYMPTRTARWPKEVVFCPHVPPEAIEKARTETRRWLDRFAREHAYTRRILLGMERSRTPVSGDIPLWLAGQTSFASGTEARASPSESNEPLVVSVHAYVDKALGRVECYTCYRGRNRDEERRYHEASYGPRRSTPSR